MTNRITTIVLRGQIGDLVGKMTAAGASVRKAAGEMTAATKEGEKFRRGLTTVGTAATRTGLVAAAGVALITKAAIDWESAWAGVTKTINGTPAQLSAIESGIRSMARELPSSHEELAGIAEAAGQLGVQTPNILEFTRVMADLAQTTNLTADEAATSIAQLMNVMQTAPDDVDNLGAALVALGNNGASTERDIIQMAQNIAGAGAVVGASEADVLALSNALASVGIDAEAGGSSVSKILIDMSTAVSTNSGKLKTWAAVAGQTTEQFAQSFRDRPVEAFNAFTQGLGRVNDAGGDVFSILSSLGQTDIRVTRALLGMAKSGDLLTDSLQLGTKAWTENTALVQEAAKRYDTTAAKASVAWNDIKDAAIDAGQGMLPVVASVAEGVGKITSAFSSLPEPVKGSVSVLGLFGAGSLLAVGSAIKLVTTVSDARKALDNLGTTMPKTAGAIGKVGRAAGTAALAFTAMEIAGKFLNSGEPAGVAKYADAILDLSDKAGHAKGNLNSLFKVDSPSVLGVEAFKDINGLDDAIGALDDRFTNSSIAGGLGLIESRAGAASKVFAQFDAALRSLADSGATEQAAAGFDYVSKKLRDAGYSTEEIAKILPTYSEYLQETANKQKIAGDSAKDMGKKLADMSPEAQAAAQKLAELKKATFDAATAFLSFDDNLDTNKKSFQDYIKGLEEMARAQENWADNLIKATARGVDEGVIQKFQEMGPEGAKRLAQLAKASDKEIARVNAAFRSSAESAQRLSEILHDVPAEVLTSFKTPGAKGAIDTAVEVAKKYKLTPDQVQTIMEALDYASGDIKKVRERLEDLNRKKARPTVSIRDDATGKIRKIQQYIDGMHGKTVKIAVQGGTPGGLTLDANGSIKDFYANGGFAENHVAQIVPVGTTRVWNEPEAGGEAYIPFAPAKKKRSQQIALEAVARLGGVAAFADGGMRGGIRGGSDGTASPLLAQLASEDVRRLGDYIIAASQNVAHGAVARNNFEQERAVLS